MVAQVSYAGLSAVAATPATDTIGGPKVAQEAEAVVAVNKPAAPEPVPKAPATPAEVSAAAKQIETYLRTAGREFEFRVDEDTHITVVTIREAATGEVIRQIPNEEVLQLARNLGSRPNALLDLKI